jgi:hypothetical protein
MSKFTCQSAGGRPGKPHDRCSINAGGWAATPGWLFWNQQCRVRQQRVRCDLKLAVACSPERLSRTCCSGALVWSDWNRDGERTSGSLVPAPDPRLCAAKASALAACGCLSQGENWVLPTLGALFALELFVSKPPPNNDSVIAAPLAAVPLNPPTTSELTPAAVL